MWNFSKTIIRVFDNIIKFIHTFTGLSEEIGTPKNKKKENLKLHFYFN